MRSNPPFSSSLPAAFFLPQPQALKLIRVIFLVGWCCLLGVVASAQSTDIPLGSRDYRTLDRLEIKTSRLPSEFMGETKPKYRQAAALFVSRLDTLSPSRRSGWDLSRVDHYNMDRLAGNNREWVTDSNLLIPSKHPLWKSLYLDPDNLFAVHQKDFFLSVNPVLLLQMGHENGNQQHLFINTRGIEIRGLIAKKLGFYTYISDNQERDPLYVQDRIAQYKAVPGMGYYKSYGGSGVDYFNSDGYITFAAIPKYLEVEFGYGKNFLGDGYRSLFLSDYSNNYLYLKLNTKIWKFDYENIFAEVISQFNPQLGDYLRPKKYIALHHLSLDVTHWLNIGLFEAVSFSRPNYFDFNYLNPVIFLKPVEEELGSSDKAHVGLDLKADVAHHFQFYSQFLLDEFKLGQFFSHSGWWGNKWALQLGGKYVDAFGIPNLDLQGEINLVRPYTYAHYDTISNYTNYNQPLAHPLGANFREFIGVVRYQPFDRLVLTAKLIYDQQGLDTLGSDWGGDIFLNYNNREMEFGNRIGQGVGSKVLYGSLVATYEIRDNLFVDLTFLDRKEGGPYYQTAAKTNTQVISAGIRWNIGRREFDY
ncbi:MAG: hypothetical protein ACYCOO_02270 [Chitinophagaceae bacterium]